MLGWIALAALALGVAVLAVMHFCRRTTNIPVAVYYEGNPDITGSAAVLFRKEVVGGIDSIHAGLRCLQLVVRRFGDEDWLESATIELDSACLLGDDITGVYQVRYRQHAVTIAPVKDSASGRPLVTIAYDPGTTTWTMTVDAAAGADTARRRDAVVLNEARANAGGTVLTAANEIGIGKGLRIRWNEPAIHACVFMHLDTARIRKLSNLRAVPVAATVATLSTGFALARPGVRLTLPPVAANGSLVKNTLPEMMPKQDFDLYAVLNEVGGYLTDRRKTFAPPHNRVERAVSNLNDGLRNLDSIALRVEDLTSDVGQYLSSPGALRRAPRTRADSLIADLNALRGIIAAARDDIGVLGGKAGRVVENIDRTTVPRLNISLDNLSTSMQRIDTLVGRFDQLAITVKDTTLYRAEGSLKSFSDDVSEIRDEVRRLIRTVNTLVIQLR